MSKHKQAVLIDLESQKDPNVHDGLSWSYRRRESVEDCTRRYFFQYYSRNLKDAELRGKVELLKATKNRHLRAGQIVHLVIGTYFKKLKVGRSLSPDWLTQWAKNLFLEDRNYSRHIRGGGKPSDQKYPPVILDEIVNGKEGHNALISQAEGQIIAAIRNFFGPAFSAVRTLGASRDAYVEHKLSLEGFPVPVRGKVDLAVRDSTLVRVIDWKLGASSDGGAESLQLATYGLWTRSEFGVPDENVRVAKAHLLTQEVAEFKADSNALTNARIRILQDIERMAILHRYGREGAIEAFTPNPQKGLCQLCQFLAVCPEGKAILDA